jgi:uncharacterized protein (TIGR02722 family)
MKNLIKGLAVLLTGAYLSGCAINTPTVGAGKVTYGDTNAVETVNTDFGSTDLNMVVNKMSTDLISSTKLNQCKTYTVSPVRNKTDQYIDTENLTQGIVDQVSNSPRVTSTYVLSGAEMQNQERELNRQNDSGLYKSKAVRGNMRGAQCRIDGYVSNITKDNGSVKDVFYVFNMKLINIEQGTMLWVNEKQIRKDQTR